MLSSLFESMTSLTPLELLQLQGAVINELRSRSIVRTSNARLGDYTEWLPTI